MQTTNKFRLYPSGKQEEKMLWTLDRCRFVYNQMLEGLNKQEKPNKYELQNTIPKLKRGCSELKEVYSKVLQYEPYRLFSNLRALSQLKKKGRKVGRLRFKGREWFKTFTYNQSGFKINYTGKRCQILHLSKIGDIPMRMHREFKGTIKQITVKRYKSGKWYAMLTVEQKITIEKTKIRKAVGIDVGITNFTTDSDGRVINNPRNLKKSMNKLKREYQRFSRTKRNSKNRIKQRIRIAEVFESITNQRDDFLHKLSYAYVKTYDFIAVEDLKISNMLKNHHLAQSIADCSWSKFMQMLSYKAENAGKIVMKVEPRNTSQKCSQCSEIVRKNLAVRTHKCSCGASLDRDYNASLNILSLGLENYRRDCGKSSLTEIEPLLMKQVPSMMQEATSSNPIRI